MKLLEITSPTVSDRLPDLVLLTDSSLSLSDRPVFLPDFSDKWECRISPAFRIGRLGKTISRRFAHRYVDGVTAAARIIPSNLHSDGFGLSPWVTAFDGAVSIGQFVEPGLADCFSIKSPTGAASLINVNNWDIYTTIELISRYFILKNGDIIIPYGPAPRFDIVPDTHVSVAASERKLLDFNIK